MADKERGPSPSQRDQGISDLKTYSKAVDPSYHYQQMVDSQRIEQAVLPDAMVHREQGGAMVKAED